jgi:PKD repeat protein
MKPTRVLRALVAAAMLALAACTVHQTESPAPTGPSNFQVPPPPAGPTARFTVAPEKPTAFLPAVFDGSSSCPEGAFPNGCVLSDRTITGFNWDFGDGTTASGRTASHLFRATGSFGVTLTVVSDRGLSASTTRTVAVDPGVPPKADFTFSPANPGIGQSVSFNGAPSTPGPGHTIANYAWDFGDGGRGTGVTASHSFGTAGTYNVVLTVTDEAGQTATTSKSVPVAVPPPIPPPTADFVFSPTAPAAGQTVSFNGSPSTAAPGRSIVSYSWNFGDGGTASGITASHSFDTAGTYSVVLVVTDDAGKTGTVSKTVPVASGAPTARLSLTKAGGNNILADGSASTATGTSVIVSYSFNWGDPTGSTTGSSPSQPHTYVLSGTYTVVLTVTDDRGRAATTSQTITVP